MQRSRNILRGLYFICSHGIPEPRKADNSFVPRFLLPLLKKSYNRLGTEGIKPVIMMKTIIYIFCIGIVLAAFISAHQQSEQWLEQKKKSLMERQSFVKSNRSESEMSYDNEETVSIASEQAKITLISDRQEDFINGYAYQTYQYRIEITFFGDFNSTGGGKITFKNIDTGESFSLTRITLEDKEFCNDIKEGKSIKDIKEYIKKSELLVGLWIFDYKSSDTYISEKRHLLRIHSSIRSNGKAEMEIYIKTLDNKEGAFYIHDITEEQMETLINI